MKNIKVILWLVFFFPIGLFLMFKETNWPKPVKYGISGISLLFLLLGGLELLIPLLMLGSFSLIIYSIFSFIRKRDWRRSLAFLAAGIIIITIANPIFEAQVAESERIEMEVQAEEQRLAEEKAVEEERLAKEKAEKEEQERQAALKKQAEEEHQQEQEALTAKVLKAIEKVREEPTKRNYDKAKELMEGLDQPETLAKRLETIKPDVEAYEEAFVLAQEAVKLAEEEKTRSSYEQAEKLVAVLSVPNSLLNKQLKSVDEEITELEEVQAQEERLAAKQAAEEAEKQAAAQAAEQERVAEEQRVAAAKAASSSSNNSGGSNSSGHSGSSTSPPSQQQQPSQPKATPPPPSVQETPPPVASTEQVVYVAPQSGKKYHFDPGCRGLRTANSTVQMSVSEAQSQGYGLCGFED